MNGEDPKAIEVVLSLHPTDFRRLKCAAQMSRLEIEDFCKLAIHRQIMDQGNRDAMDEDDMTTLEYMRAGNAAE